MEPLLPPEARLLLLATRRPGPDVDQAISAVVSEPLNWAAVGELAEREKLLPVLWERLGVNRAAVPAPFAERLRQGSVVTEFRMRLAESLLTDVVDRLSQAGVRVMLLKGAALARTVYPSFAERPMGDVDILVAPAEAQRAWDILADAGWQPELAGGASFYDRHQHLVALLDPRGAGIVLEIHRSITVPAGPIHVPTEALWREARAVRAESHEAWVPSREHLLLHLCIHFGWSNLLHGGLGRTARDTAALIAAGGLEWARFAALAKDAKATSCAYWTLLLSKELSGADVPPEVLRTLAPRLPDILLRALARALVASALLGACPSIRVRRLLWRAAIRPRASGHTGARPWEVQDAFEEVFPAGQPAAFMTRVTAHARGWASWARFASILGTNRPLT